MKVSRFGQCRSSEKILGEFSSFSDHIGKFSMWSDFMRWMWVFHWLYGDTMCMEWFSGGITVRSWKSSGSVEIFWIVSDFLKCIYWDCADSNECVGHCGWEVVSRGNVRGMWIFVVDLHGDTVESKRECKGNWLGMLTLQWVRADIVDGKWVYEGFFVYHVTGLGHCAWFLT